MVGSAIDYPGWLAALDEADFDEVVEAAERVITLHEALANDGISLLGELLRDWGETPIEPWVHYPADDCRDPKSGAMFYYHAHEPEEWDRDEHGHFHLFVRPEADGEFSHVMAISMSAYGVPSALFATNGWVTDEVMRPAGELLQLVDERWEITRARPSWLVVQWLTAMMTLLRPQMEALLEQRDRALRWQLGKAPSTEVLEDRDTHILSELPLDLMETLAAVQAQAQARFAEA